MENSLEELIRVIGRQVEGYRSLVDLFDAERDAIVQADIDQLNAVIQEKEEALENIRLLERRRIETLDEVARRLELRTEDLTIRRLAKAVPLPFGDRLNRIADESGMVFERVQAASETNRRLCLQALAFVNGSIRLLGQLTAPGHVYRSSGHLPLDGSAGRILSGAA